jgi:hypothetical protein
MTPTMLALTVLADDTPHNTGPDFGKAGPFGLLITVVLLIATFGLVWSMNRHLKKLPVSFDRDGPRPDQAADDTTVNGADGTKPAQEPGGQPTG